MSTFPYVNSNGINSLANSVYLEQAYSDSTYYISQNENYDLTRFLMLKRAESIVKDSIGEAGPDVDAPLIDKLLGETGSAILKQVESMTAEKILQMYIDAYMAPIGTSDMSYRLGAVVGVKNIYTEYVDDKHSPSFKKAYDRDNIITDRYGRIYTRSNFDTKFVTYSWSGSSGSTRRVTIPYSNLFFPPYVTGASVKDRYDWGKIVDKWESEPLYGTEEAKTPTMDLSTFKCSRGNFTYREPAFKAINDNIQILQYLMEQTTGVVSTYLTEWDLSLYMQEGLLGKGILNSEESVIVSLLYRIKKDNPLVRKDGYYRDDRAYAFGSLNAAVSKIMGSNTAVWVPNFYPLSTYWTPYWALSEVFTDDKGLRIGPEDLAAQKILKRTGEPGSAYLPYFYFPDRNDPTTDYYQISENLSFYQKVKLVDERNAALSGWLSWDSHIYSDILYADPSDGVSDVERVLHTYGMQNCSITEAIDAMKEAIINDAYYLDGSSGGTVENTNLGSKTSQKYSTCGDKMNSMKRARYLDADDALSMAKKDANGYSSANTAIQNLMDSPGRQSIAYPANIAGIPQNNPPLFGGPHGGALSPKSPQSYFQIKNQPLLNQPRLDWDIGRHNFFNADDGYCTGITTQTMGDYYHGYEDIQGQVKSPNFWWEKLLSRFKTTINNHFGAADQSPEYALHRLKNGYHRYDYRYAYIEQYVCGRIEEIASEGSGSGYGSSSGYNSSSGSSSYYPAYINGSPVAYTGRSGYMTKVTEVPWNGFFFWGSYSSYGSGSVRRTLKTNSSGQTVIRIESKVAYREGYYWKRGYALYQRYKLAAAPESRWYITKTHIRSWSSFNGWNRFVFGILSWFSWSSRMLPLFANYCAGTEEFNRLTVPGNQYGAGYQTVVWSFNQGREMTDGSSGNETYWKTFILSEYGRNGYLIFLIGDGTISTMFECPVNVTDVAMTYRHRNSFCGVTWYTYSLGKIQYIGVDISNPTFYHADLNKTPYPGNNKTGVEGYLGTDIPASYRRTSVSPEVFMYSGGGSSTSSLDGPQAMGMSGKGIMSYLPGLDNISVTNPGYEVRHYMMAANHNGNWANTRFSDISFPYATYYGSSSGATYTNDNTRVFFAGGKPIYGLNYADYRLKTALVRAGTRATFYKSYGDGYAYYVDNAYSVGLFLNQLLWQVGFLEQLKQFYIHNVSIPVLRKLLDEYVDKTVVSVSWGGYNPRTHRLYSEESKYNYWIQKAQELFPADPAGQEQTKKNVTRAIDTRIWALNNAINNLRPLATKTADRYSWNDFMKVYETLNAVKEATDISTFEDYMMAYLNILYEYRKYFIDLRFNKQDGTMWVMRQLESVLRTFVEQLTKSPPPPVSKLGDLATPNSYKVNYYDITNSINDKLRALNSNTSLAEDRIKTVYIKVMYVGREEYEADQAEIHAGKKTEPGVVYIKSKNKYAIKPVDGPYYLDSWERQDAIRKKKWNSAQIKAQPGFPKEKLKEVIDYDDFGSWEIKWGDEQSLTPIKFGVPAGINIQNAEELLKQDAEVDAYTLVCGIKQNEDYWTVNVPTSQRPRTPGYRTKVRLSQDVGNLSYEFTFDDMYTTLCGEMGYSLWPITEEQNDLTMNDQMSEDFLKTVLQNKTQV